ncbi:MAG: DUF4185 domain-containing protein [Bacteroidales bacterium]
MKKYIQTFFILLLLVGCKNKQGTETKSDNLSDSITSFSVIESPEWESVFYRNSGWFGGDGIYAVNLDGKEDFEQKNPNIMLWFGDTMYGNIINSVLQPGFTMTHNSFAITNKNTPDSNAITFYADYRGDNKPKTILIPNSPDAGEGEYYWMGDGFVNQAKNNDLYIFGYRIKNISNEAFGFKEMGNNIVIIPSGQKPPFKNIRQLDIPFFKGMKIDSVGTFGCAILVNTKEAGVNNGDGYIYIYGIRGMEKTIYVARIKPADIEAFDKWTFWNGNSFSVKPSEIKPLITNASNEISVSSLPNGKYIFVYQSGFNGKICFQLADSPVGPFKTPVEIYDPALKFKDNKNIFTYNAKALPVFSKEGELVISYNVNSLKFFEEDLKKDSHLYRPRFITLKYTLK